LPYWRRSTTVRGPTAAGLEFDEPTLVELPNVFRGPRLVESHHLTTIETRAFGAYER
jgi:hypothetical protein